MFDNHLGAPRKQTRCVIYTRKSSEEGLEQEFNSLDAQREACEAYIKSQAHEGWLLLSNKYDDGGFSGGNMKRPGLVQLMKDIQTGEIDLVVVYKVDRLSRSLGDFSQMVDTFDKHNVSFVSITQQFNTSTSMGRLTLNVLLSFAQFEREVTGERIRDKVAASKKKGMWMGGYVPLGYDNVDKNLIINIEESKTVNYIYQQYLELGSVKALKEKLDSVGVKTKVSKGGFGGNEFSRGALYALLQNPIYIGKIKHKDKLHNGTHKPLMAKTLWNEVQKLITSNRSADYKRTESKAPSLLSGLLFDSENHPLSPSHTRKKSRRYRYYINQALIQFKQAPADAIIRVPAQTIEDIVEHDLLDLLSNKQRLISAATSFHLTASQNKVLKTQADELASRWKSFETYQKIDFVNGFIKRIRLTQTQLTITYCCQSIINNLLEHADFDEELLLEATVQVQLKRCGVETKLIVEADGFQNKLEPHADSLRAIQEAIQRGLTWNQKLVEGKVISAKEIAKQNDVSDRYVSQCIKLSFLSPAIIKRIFKGDIPHNMTLKTLKAGIPYNWEEQEKLFAC